MAAAVLTMSACVQPRMSPAECAASMIQRTEASDATWSATSSSGRIEGEVRELDGGPISNVAVELASLGRSRRTDGHGAFHFDSLPSGSYRLITQGTGYESRVDSVGLTPGHGAKVDMRLRLQRSASRACQTRLPAPRLLERISVEHPQ
jgi:hypothetical protein